MTFAFIRKTWYCRLISVACIVTLVTAVLVAPMASAAVMGLPQPGAMVNLSPAYVPPMITGLTIHPENPLLMDFIVSTGNSALNADEVKIESGRLIKYFLACLTIPENNQWVNLSPYEKDRIIPEDLGQTVLGRDMLAQDYLLKQLTASLIYPEKNLGRIFWDNVYAKARSLYGTAAIPVNTFNKVWILPDTARVFEHQNTVFVVKSHFKVMLDEDYLALQKHQKGGGINTLGSNIVRRIILPAIEQEVNKGRNFAQLRQIYNSMILAVWFKKNLKQALLNQVYTDKSKVNGVKVDDPAIKEKIYEQYLQAYKKGVFNYIKEEADPKAQGMVPRKYFSGGLTPVTDLSQATADEARAAFSGMPGKEFRISGLTQEAGNQAVHADAAMSGDNLKTANTVTPKDFQDLVKLRQKGSAGIDKNIDPTPVVPAPEEAVFNWQALNDEEKQSLEHKQQQMFSHGRIAALDMVGGEATRFGGPKTFVKISDELGDFMAVKAANQRYINELSGRDMPRYAMTSEKRRKEFLEGLKARDYYGLGPEDIRTFVQGTVDTFILTDAEIEASFTDPQTIAQYKAFAAKQRKKNPDGIYRFKGKTSQVPAGHFDAIASFIISGQMTDALQRGVKFISIENIDNLQAILKPDGMIAKFDEMGVDFGFILAEKNMSFTIKDSTGNILVDKLIVRFRDNVISFDGIKEYLKQALKDGRRFVINQKTKTVDVYDIATGNKIPTQSTIKPETGGTLVQPVDEDDNTKPVGDPIMREGFELPQDFDHVNAPFFNTNSIVMRLEGVLRILGVSPKELKNMDWEQRSNLVREKLVKAIKPNFELKNHEVEGEYPELGIVKNGKTKIPVAQLTRIMLQSAHLPGVKVGYIFAPRAEVFAPVKEPEDLKIAAANNRSSLSKYTDYGSDAAMHSQITTRISKVNRLPITAIQHPNRQNTQDHLLSKKKPGTRGYHVKNWRQGQDGSGLPDAAMLGNVNGGIDLNSRNLNMQSAGQKVNIIFDPVMIEQFKRGDFSGVTIKILDAVPVNLLLLLGFNKD